MQTTELIYRSGCPKLALARAQLRRAFAAIQLEPTWREWCSDDPNSPAHVRQLASPTFLVRGADVCATEMPNARQQTCRVYRCGREQRRAVPTVEQLAGVLRARSVAAFLLPDSPANRRGRASHNWSDEALMVGHQHCDASAFELLFERYRRRLQGYFRRRFGNGDVAADLCQRTMLRVHCARHDYDAARPFVGWVFSIAANLAKDELKRQGRRPGDTRWCEPDDALATGLCNPEHRAAASEDRRSLRSAMLALPAAQREVIVLHKLQGLSFPEVANTLGEGVEAVKSRAFRGYRSLRKLIEADRVTPACCA